VQFHTFFTWAADRGGWSGSQPSWSNMQGSDPLDSRLGEAICRN